jgi:hypothetical protein
MSGYWHEQDFELKFQISDFILFRKRIPILAHACTLSEILAGSTPTSPDDLPRDCKGFMLRSCPGKAVEHQFEKQDHFVAYTMASYQHCYIDLRSTFADYQAKFSSKSRGTIARKKKKFETHCKEAMRFERFQRPQEMQRFHTLARQVSLLTYQEKLLDTGLPGDPEFVEGMLTAAEQGNTRGYLLSDGDRPTAYLYCPIVDGTVVYAYLGFDPAYADWSVGTILLWLAFENIFDEGAFSYFDFTEGSSAQKQFFSTHKAACHNTLHLHNTLGNRLLISMHARFDQASGNLGRLLDRWGMKSAIKHVLRGR